MRPRGSASAWASRAAAALAAALLVVLGCGGDDPCDSVAGPAVVASVALTPSDPSVAVGESLLLEAVPLNSCGGEVDDASVSWSTSDAGVASVTPAGSVTGMAVGDAVITAFSEGKSANVTVTVQPAAVADVIVVPGEGAIGVGQQLTLMATAYDEDGNVLEGRPATWSSGEPTIASVSSAGVVKGEQVGGPVRITATIEGVEGAASVTVLPEPAPTLTFIDQPPDGQAGEPLDPPVRVAVTDQNGDIITDDDGGPITIGLAANPGGATLSGTESVTPVDGVATFSNLIFDKVGTGYTLVAFRADATPTNSGPFDITAGEAVRLVFTVHPDNGTSGAPLRPVPTVAVRDALGNVVSSPERTVTVRLSDNPTDAELGGTRSVTTVNGIARFDDLTVDLAGSGYALGASSTGLDSDESGSFSIAPGAPAALDFVQQPTTTPAGEIIDPPVTVRVTDAAGNRVEAATTAITLSLAANPQAATLGGTTTRNAVDGIATFDDLTVNKLGIYALRATASGLEEDQSNPFGITGGLATRLGFRTQPPNGTAGAPLSPAVEVVILDALGNVVDADRTISVELAAGPGGAVLGGNTSVSSVAGVARFTSLEIEKAGTGYQLRAEADELTSETSDGFAIAAGPLADLTFATQPTNGTAGTTLSAVSVALTDEFGNPVTDAAGPVTIELSQNPTNAELQGTLSVAPTAGVATFSNLRIDVASTGYQLGADAPGVSNAVSNTFAIAAGTATGLRFLIQPNNEDEDENIQPAPRVGIVDAFGNIVPIDGTIITLSIGSNPGGADPGLHGDRTRPTDNGIANFSSLRVDEPGTGYTLVASAPGLGSAETDPFNVST
ncbi:MAG: Ig-like domain-containing protein [Gemmatimonadales bacterium]